MNDKIGKLPKISSSSGALVEILRIAKDKRSHVLMSDECDWLELKLKTIEKIVYLGLKARAGEVGRG